MVEIYQRHMEGGQDHEHIAKVKWVNHANNKYGESTRESMVKWLDDSKENTAYVEDLNGKRKAYVGTVHPTGRLPYIRTYADGKWTNNLLSLPEY